MSEEAFASEHGEGLPPELDPMDARSPEFTRRVARRQLAQAQLMRGRRAARLGRLVRVLRERRGLTRTALVEQGGPPLEWLFMLEHDLLRFDELTRQRVGLLAAALQIPDSLLTEACGFSLADCVDDRFLAVIGVGFSAEAHIRKQTQKNQIRRFSLSSASTDSEQLPRPGALAGPIFSPLDPPSPPSPVGMAELFEATRRVLVVADLSERQYDWAALHDIVRELSVRKLATAALLFYASDSDPTLATSGDLNPEPVRQAIAPFLDLEVTVRVDTLRSLTGAPTFFEASLAAAEEAARIVSDVLELLSGQASAEVTPSVTQLPVHESSPTAGRASWEGPVWREDRTPTLAPERTAVLAEVREVIDSLDATPFVVGLCERLRDDTPDTYEETRGDGRAVRVTRFLL